MELVERFRRCATELDVLLADVGLEGFESYITKQPDPDGHWIDTLHVSAAPPAQESPKVSVIMTVHNDAATIRQAIESVLRSSDVEVEIIAVDDASTDMTPEVVSGIQDKRVRLISNARNLGPYVSRSRGLAAASGDF